MSDDTEWPNYVRMAPGAISVAAVGDLREPLAIATQTKVSSPDPGFELHFLRGLDLDVWRSYAAELERSGAYAKVELVRLSLHGLPYDEGTQPRGRRIIRTVALKLAQPRFILKWDQRRVARGRRASRSRRCLEPEAAAVRCRALA